MGIVVETSMGRRSGAALGADAVRDDAGEDEDHARDGDDVGDVLAPEPLVAVMARRAEMDRDVEKSTSRHEHQTDEDHGRQVPCLLREVYRKHVLVIQAGGPIVNCIDSVRM
jgi:hypothetical protein